MVKEDMMYDPTSKEEAVALCRELGIDPEKFWGVVNNFACDCFYAGQVDAKREAIAASSSPSEPSAS
jgi:3-hydroxyisobutyrate dehydrogenase-like beta-hydroxyacid dehydrogenase